jgi:protein involved in polysaccharide export with SLBB domain
MRIRTKQTLFFCFLSFVFMFSMSASALAQPGKAAPAPATKSGAQPFGANLFSGSYQGQHQDGRNSNYKVMPGDRVVVNTWGALEINKIFVVDGQGNIFLPSIGPVPLAGVKNGNLTNVVRAQIGRVYRTGVGVYTNLLTAAPVGVYVTGGVPRPGRYAGVPADSVLFFLNQAGGIEAQSGSYRKISVLRENKSIAEIDLYDFILNGSLPQVQFADGDTVLVRRRGPTVLLRGEVTAPAHIELLPEQSKGADALLVVPKAARATAVSVQGTSGSGSYSKTMSVEDFAARPLRDGDTVFLRVDGRPETILITLEGEFHGPSLMSITRGARLLDLLNYVAVDPKLADVKAVHVRRKSVAVAQKKSIDDSLHRLERSAMLALSNTDTEAAIRVREAELLQNFVKSARTIQPLGRVVTASRGQQQNLMLSDGDTIVIPSKTNVVRIGGEVRMTQAVVYTPGMTAGDYIARAGGFTDRADDDRIIIMHASAEVTMGDEDSNVRPGDELLVAPAVDSKIFQNVSDITQVLYQIAVAAAVVLAI